LPFDSGADDAGSGSGTLDSRALLSSVAASRNKSWSLP
jgi:hypothetical protein